MNRILVIRGGAIGDFVLTLPALKLLRDAYPAAQIEILGYKHIVALAEGRFYAQAVHSIEYGKLAGFFAKGAELDSALSDYFASFDLVLSYLFDPDAIFERNVRHCGVEEFLVGSPKIIGLEHAVRQLARPLVKLDLELTDPAAHLYPSLGDRDFAADILRTLKAPVVAVHPGSGSPTKNWPVENWAELAALLLRRGHGSSLLVIGGEADERELAAFRVLAETSAIRIAEALPLPEVAALLEGCACFIGHDSGVSQIAAAVGAPSVLLFGPTDPAVWAPQNENVRVLRAVEGDLGRIDTDAVAEAVVQELMRIGIST